MIDTTAKIASLVRHRMLALSGAERMVISSRMFDDARTMALASFPSGLSDIEVKARLCKRLYAEEVNVEGFVEYMEALSQTA